MKYRLHVQPDDCVLDHKYSIYENDEAIILANTLQKNKDKPRQIVDILNSHVALSSQVEALRRALEEAKNCLRLSLKRLGEVCPHEDAGKDFDAAFEAFTKALASIPSPQAKGGAHE